MKVWLLALCAVALTGCTARTGADPNTGQAGAEFYKGRTVTIIVGFAPGGGFDTVARALALHYVAALKD